MRALLLLTFVGLMLGVLGDVATGIEFTMDDLVGAILLSPVLAVVGGGVVGQGAVSDVFMIGGLLFWPLWALLAWRWMKARSVPLGVLIVLWSAQGFFQLIHRLGQVMSV